MTKDEPLLIGEEQLTLPCLYLSIVIEATPLKLDIIIINPFSAAFPLAAIEINCPKIISF